MSIRDVATIRFFHQESGRDGVVIVRAGASWVGVCLSLLEDGDIEVFLIMNDAIAVHDAIARAISYAGEAQGNDLPPSARNPQS